MSRLACATLLVFTSAMGIQAQTALVTFYSTGCHLCGKKFAVGVTAGSAVIAYRGAIYDGEDKIVNLITANKFVTFRLSAGPHSFAGQNVNGLSHKRDNEEKDLRLTLLPNQHYYIRLGFKDKGVYVARHFTTLLTATECTEAFDEAHKTDPLSAKQLDGKFLIQIERGSYFPACENANTLNVK